MRTTVDLPPDLFRKAKARAAQRGETLKALLTRAVAADLGEAHDRPAARTRVELPLFGDPNAPAIRVTPPTWSVRWLTTTRSGPCAPLVGAGDEAARRQRVAGGGVGAACNHRPAKRWIDEEGEQFAFCRVTQMALVRLITNPAIMQRDSLSRRQAWELVDRLMADPVPVS